MKSSTLIKLLGLILIAGMAQSQELPQQDSEKNTDQKRTQVVCYAAEDRWVCVPRGSEKPDVAINQEKQATESEQASTAESTQPQTEPMSVNPLDPPEGVESFTDTAPEQTIANPMTETPEDALTEQSPQATVVTKSKQPANELTKTEQDLTADPVETTTQSPDYVGDNWFERYPDHWTIQIVGVANQQNLETFVRQQQLTAADYRIVETVASGAPWWVVIYGHYPDREAADEARMSLPDHIATDAWLRPLSSLTGE